MVSKLNPDTPRIWLPDVTGERRAVCSTEFLVSTPKPPATREFLFSLFSSEAFTSSFATLVTGTSNSHQRVKPDNLLTTEIVIPDVRLIAAFTKLAQPWLAQTTTALPVIMLITVWEWTGVTFVLYYAAISQIDSSVLEAARLDGAGNTRIIRSIIWPSVSGTTIALATLGAIGALKTFDVPYLVSGGSMGPNDATQFLGTYIYQMTITLDHVGYGAALSIILLVIAVIFGVALQISGRKRRMID